MKQRVIAAFAAFGLVAVMSGLGTIPAMAEEPVEPPTTVVEETTPTEEPAPTVEETTPPVEEAAPPVEEAAPPVEEAAPPVEDTEPPAEETDLPVDENKVEEAAGPEPPAASFARVQSSEVQALGVAGTPYPWSSDTNHAWYWEAWIAQNAPHANAICYEHDNDKWNNAHGSLTQDGKNVVLKPYGNDWPGDHYELLVVKAGSEYNLVTVHPTAGTEYSAYDGKDVSHYIVCKGDTPPPTAPVASASVKTTPGTCEAAGTVVPDVYANATYDAPTYQNGQYTIVFHAVGDAKFADGPGVTDNGKTKTFTGPVDAKLSDEECVKVSFCHAADADNGKVQFIYMADKPPSALNGHKQHAADILPAYGDFEGLNLETVYGDKTGAEWLESGGCPDVNVKGIKPTAEKEQCEEGKAVDGSITLYFDGIEGKVKYHITGGPGDVDIWVESDDNHVVPLPGGEYTVTAHAIDPYHLWGKSSWDLKIKDADCTEVTICHWNKYQPWLLWTEMTVTETQALQHAASDSKDIIPAFGDFAGKNLDEYFFEFWTGEQILVNHCDKPYFETDLCHWDKKDQKWYPVTVGPIELAAHILLDSKDIIPPVGDYDGKNLTTDFDGVTGQQIYEHDCTKKVWVPEPEYGGEQCYDGETVDGWIGVKYTSDMLGKLQYRITSTDGYDYVVPAALGWTYVDVPAGDYTVTAEPIGGWVPKGNSPYELTISSATNCQCYVPDEVNEKLALLADIAPVCAEAAVSVTPPSCEAGASLVLGDTLFATFGEPVIADGTYTVIATADEGYRFAPGEGVSEDGFTKEFTGDLPGKLTACGDLTTLALTGGGGGNLLWVAVLATMLGIGAVVAVNRRTAK